jgi:signal transduction histidine kinase
VGRSPGPLRVAPISHAGELLGVIVVNRREGAVAFREEDDRVLTELDSPGRHWRCTTRSSTPALQSSLDELRRQADELRASRARVVASGDAERRKVERNLHDGAQQHLVALAINLRLAKDVVEEDPKAAVEMLENSASRSRTPSRSCANWPTASTRRCWSTVALPKRSRRWPTAVRSTSN